MRIGLMRERVTLQRSAPRQSSTGAVTMVWTDIATVWASVDGLSVREVFLAQQADAIATCRLRMRYRSDVTHAWRGRWRGRTLEFVSVIPKENLTVLEIIAREVV